MLWVYENCDFPVCFTMTKLQLIRCPFCCARVYYSVKHYHPASLPLHKRTFMHFQFQFFTYKEIPLWSSIYLLLIIKLKFYVNNKLFHVTLLTDISFNLLKCLERRGLSYVISPCISLSAPAGTIVIAIYAHYLQLDAK